MPPTLSESLSVGPSGGASLCRVHKHLAPQPLDRPATLILLSDFNYKQIELVCSLAFTIVRVSKFTFSFK